MVVVDERGLQSSAPSSRARRQVHLRVHLLRPAGLAALRQQRVRVRKALGRQLAQETRSTRTWSSPCPTRAPGRHGLRRGSRGSPSTLGWSAATTWAAPSSSRSSRSAHFGVKLKLNPAREELRGKRVVVVDDSPGARHHQPQDREDAARRRRPRGAPAHLQPAHHAGLLLRHRHAHAGRSSSPPTTPSTRSAEYVTADSLGYLSLAGPAPGSGRRARASATPASPATTRCPWPRRRAIRCRRRRRW